MPCAFFVFTNTFVAPVERCAAVKRSQDATPPLVTTYGFLIVHFLLAFIAAARTAPQSHLPAGLAGMLLVAQSEAWMIGLIGSFDIRQSLPI